MSHVSGNQLQALCKISQWSQPLSHLLSPKRVYGLARWLSGWRCLSQGWLSWVWSPGTTGGRRREPNMLSARWPLNCICTHTHMQTHTQHTHRKTYTHNVTHRYTHTTHMHTETHTNHTRHTHRKTHTQGYTQTTHISNTRHTCTNILPCTHTCAYIHMHMLTCTHTYAHTHILTHTNTH